MSKHIALALLAAGHSRVAALRRTRAIALTLALSLLAACDGRQAEQAMPDEPTGGATEAAEGEESAAQLAKDDAFDQERAGTRLTLSYDAGAKAFAGAVANVASDALSQVRVEVHLSNGTELGPTPPVDLAPGETAAVRLAAAGQDFETWSAHAEVGTGEHGSEHEAHEQGERGEAPDGHEGGEREHGEEARQADPPPGDSSADERDASERAHSPHARAAASTTIPAGGERDASERPPTPRFQW